MKIPEAVCGSHNCSPFWFHLYPTTPFVLLFFLHFDNWAIYRINRWHRSDLVFSSVKSRPSLKFRSIGLFRAEQDRRWRSRCFRNSILYRNSFFFFIDLIDCLIRTLIFEQAPCTCVADRRIYILRGLSNCVTFDFIQPRNYRSDGDTGIRYYSSRIRALVSE